jgi:phosphatidate phosphatase APP1
MQNFNTRINRIVHTWKKRYALFKFRLVRRTGSLGPVGIFPYLGFGSEQGVFIKGRVMEDKGIKPATEQDSVWQNLKAMYKRFTSNEIPYIRLKATFDGVSKEVVTDEEGYFEVHLKPDHKPNPDQPWQPIELELLDRVVKSQGPVKTTGYISVPPQHSKFGVISDLDDTVLVTQAHSFFMMLRLTLLNNSSTRVPFEGVAAFYQALQSGPVGSIYNPMFYVSSSPWNLFEMLVEFCDLHDIPRGPFMLRDIAFDLRKMLGSSHHSHKLTQIEHILGMYPNLNFILIGDSGQHDPEIYLQAIKDYPGRVKAVYIRDVGKDKRRPEIASIGEEMQKLGVDMLLVDDTEAAARHAVANNYIEEEALADIITEKMKDEQAPSDLEQLIGAEKG